MSVDYTVLDPTGNITILVTSPVPEVEQPAVAAALMKKERTAEQVGFISRAEGFDLALRMAGGEFCGNASMCAAVLAAREKGISEGTLNLRVSGASGPVRVRVKRQEDMSWLGSVAMPRPLSVETKELPGLKQRPVVFFEGIAHIIIEGRYDRAAAEALAPELAHFLQADAVGLMFLDPENETLAPLVYVPGAGTLCWENSCASGTTAVGACLAARSGGEIRLALSQPGGVLQVSVREDGPPVLTGTVRVMKTV